MKVAQLRQVKRVLAARARHGIATPAEIRRLNYTRRILEFRRELFIQADRQMGDLSP